mgnify:CR=1 FL=1
MFNSIHEECGVFGIFSNHDSDIASTVYYGLFALQHRGQESCGIAVNSDGIINCYKNNGIVNDVFTPEILAKFEKGSMAVGHVRYGTTGGNSRVNAQPIVVNHIKGAMALAHNGNLTNAYTLRRELELSGAIFHTTSDTEVIAYEITKARINTGSIEEAVNCAMNVIKGAYSLVIMSPSKMIAARDPHGFRPLCIGKRDDDYIFASESCALDSIGAEFIRDVEPGEIVVIDKNGMRTIRDHCGQNTSLCVFEYIYFARPDSVIDKSSVHEARKRAGAFLAKEYPVDADVVIGVPDSGLDAAIGYACESGIPYGIGFIKNKYIARTFIQPSQADRENKVRIKLNTLSATVKNKRVVMIDDSIVRGTTCARIVNLLREAGASEVHVRISAPPFKHPCYFGTDIDSEDVLIANKMSIDEICREIGADSLGYLSVENVKKIASDTNLGFCTACFDGDYPVPVPKHKNKTKFMNKISENKEISDD